MSGSAEDELADAEEVATTGVTFAADVTAVSEPDVALSVSVVDDCTATTAADSELVAAETTAVTVVVDAGLVKEVVVVEDDVTSNPTSALNPTLVEVVDSVQVEAEAATLTFGSTGHQVGKTEVLDEGLIVTLMRGAESAWKG